MLSNKFLIQKGPERCISVSAAEAKSESVQEARGSNLSLPSPDSKLEMGSNQISSGFKRVVEHVITQERPNH